MRDLRSISIKVDLFAGTDIRDACCDVCELANRMGCLIEASFNGVRLWAREGSNPLTLADAYEKELISKSSFKIAKGW